MRRRILVRTRVDSTTCGSTQETGDPYACQQSVIRTVWDGDQILKESRYLGGWQYSGAQLDGPNGSGAFFGTVRTTQTGAIDVPLLVWLDDSDPHVLHRNWRGNVGGATEVATGYANLTMAWPAAFTDVRHAPESRLDPPTPTGWWGSLVENQKDVTGLLYRRNRYYDPVSGRFTQEDPIGLAGGMNLYGYAGGDPINNHDPFGLDCKKREKEGTPCNLNTGNKHLDDPAVRDKLEDAWDLGVATPDPTHGGLPSEVAISCKANAECSSGVGNAVSTGTAAQAVFGWGFRSGGVLYMHTHQNAGVAIPGYGVGNPGPSGADLRNAATMTKAGMSYYIFEPSRIIEVKANGTRASYNRWAKP